MPKSKSQAQKNEERQQRQQEEGQKRAEEKRIRDLELQKNRPALPKNDIPTIINRKELRKLKKAQEQGEKPESTNTEEEKTTAEELSIKQDALEVDLLSLAIDDEAPLKLPPDIKAPAANVEAKITLKNPDNTQPSSSLIPPYSSKSSATDTKDGDGYIQQSFKPIMKTTLKVAAEQIEKEKSEISANGHNARIVLNHSTHCEGLKTVLMRLSKLITGCTITPGRLSTVQSKSDYFVLEFQRATDKHTYQLVARNGHTAQDVLISVSDPEIYTEEVIREKIAEAQEKNLSEKDKPAHDEEVCSSQLNRSVHNARQSFWRNEHQEKDAYQKARDKEAKHQVRLKAQERKLAGKDIPNGLRADIAARDVDIITGVNRTKNSM